MNSFCALRPAGSSFLRRSDMSGMSSRVFVIVREILNLDDEPCWADWAFLSRGVNFFGAIALEWLQMLMDCAGYDSAGEGTDAGKAFFERLLAVDGAKVA